MAMTGTSNCAYFYQRAWGGVSRAAERTVKITPEPADEKVKGKR
jgi:hypothetical protein